ncbi:MAG: rhodanese-like domain-containing protein, partial [Thermanaerothrix sp.]|nr:rhodanese-like domain-containing protein [Thermanaerothrix sp.]
MKVRGVLLWSVLLCLGLAVSAFGAEPFKGAEPSVLSNAPASADAVQAKSSPATEPLKGPEAFAGVEFLKREEVYVTPSWLMANMGKVLVLDARAQSLYLKGHIPGAVNAEWTYFVSMKGRPGDQGWGVRLPMP